MRAVCQIFLWLGAVAGLVMVSCTPQNFASNSLDSSPASTSIAPTRPAASLPVAQAETPVTPNTAQTTAQDIWAEMRQETGYVVLLRHAETVSGTGDPPEFQLDDCATQRNLSAAGKAQAARIGRAFRDRNIPIHQVLSSQYCRCLDTARLLALGDVESAPMLNSTFTNRSNEAEQMTQVRQRILNHRTTSGVIVMVSHFVNIGSISGVNPPEGGAVVVRTDQQGDLEVAGQIQGL